ncbi:hypothetical protein [Enhygromyxa salina]|uniref:Uncharacterized protein n=1 Tax=Enhygromyxa salina TaxID=215803 RepID=A0A2S9XTL3_9BACT|nr:hypothetical protein [Enhygromyxa salina]PRP96174.1 hypothetical protein ENSA7_69880 [Enhygromyxa salina]
MRLGPYCIEPTPLADVAPERGVELTLTRAGAPMSWAEVAHGWVTDLELAAVFVDALAATPYPALFWETTPCAGPTSLPQLLTCPV